MVKIADHYHQSTVISAYAIFVSDILGKTEGVVVLNVIDNNDNRLDA